MANSTIWVDSVEVSAAQLVTESKDRVADSKFVATNSGSLGVISGLAVTISPGTTTNIAIAAGTAYANNGEILTFTGQQNIPLADYTLGTANYVALMYNEVYSRPEANESTGTTSNTVSTVVPRLVILTFATWTSLPATDPILINNALDRACLLAIVTANGPAVALTSGSIKLPTIFSSSGGVLQVTQPPTITGVVVYDIQQTTKTGTGTLTYVASGNTIKWAAPGDTAGSTVVIGASGKYTIISNAGAQIYINVSFSLLPATDKTDSIFITNLYSQTVTRFTNQDLYHRSMLGSGLPSPTNPHGLTVGDLDNTLGSVLEEHQDIQHVNGISHLSSSTLLAATVNTAGADTLSFTGFASGDDIVYLHGKQVITAAPLTNFSPCGTSPSTQYTLYGVYLTSDGLITSSVRVLYPTPTLIVAGGVPAVQVVNCSDNIGTTSFVLKLDTSGYLSFDGGNPFLVSEYASNAYIRLYSKDFVSWIDVFIAASIAVPGSNLTDTLSFTAEPTRESNFPLCYVLFSGSATQFLGYGFSGGQNNPNAIVDRRVFGNMSALEMLADNTDANTSSLREFQKPITSADLSSTVTDGIIPYNFYNGLPILIPNEFNLTTIGSNTGILTGGKVIVGGRLFNVPTQTVSVPSSLTSVIYVDYAGKVRSWVNTAAGISAVNALNQNRNMVVIYTVVIDGSGNEILVSRVDNRLNVINTYLKNRAFGVPGLAANGATTITSSNTGVALTAYNTYGGHAINSHGGVAITAINGANAIDATGNIAVTGDVGATGAIGASGLVSANGGLAVTGAIGASGLVSANGGLAVTADGVVVSSYGQTIDLGISSGSISTTGGNISTASGDIYTSSGNIIATGQVEAPNVTRAWGRFTFVNSPGSLTKNDASGISGITYDADGVCTVTLTAGVINSGTSYGVQISPWCVAGFIVVPYGIGIGSISATSFTFQFFNTGSVTVQTVFTTAMSFTLSVFSSTNDDLT